MRLRLLSIAPAWAVAVLGIVLVVLFAPAEEYLAWVPVVFAVGMLVMFVLQLPVPSAQGLGQRLTLGVGVLLGILVVATILLAVLGSVAGV